MGGFQDVLMCLCMEGVHHVQVNLFSYKVLPPNLYSNWWWC